CDEGVVVTVQTTGLKYQTAKLMTLPNCSKLHLHAKAVEGLYSVIKLCAIP
ncbi:hypothetical protein J6590_078276, partial [Homalodisca vitripennis]